MRVGLTLPDQDWIQIVEAPDDADARWHWLKNTVDGDLDWNTLPAWTGPLGIVSLVVNDWGLVKGLARNAVASGLYQEGWPDAGKLRHPGISGPGVVVFEDAQGTTSSVPDEIVDAWILRGYRVAGW